ncbi:MAG TPA: PilX N-terminal domain-containing pilus assembly protein [Gemmatimonadales bacterium]|nr:PilX N-terminal domain-containing pilus assembly protein [Gemmatimonadales bacterium]
MRPARRPVTAPARIQRGATLVILLITLLVITLLSVTTIRSTVMDEKMAGNARDRNKAFQAAEAAVQACLDRIDAQDFAGITRLTPATSPDRPVWEVPGNWATALEVRLTASGTPAESGLAQNPRCMVEDLADQSWRVTGRAVGGSDSSVVVLQATYSAE